MNSSQPHLYTIGFTEKSAAEFFELLSINDVRKLIDTRLNNVSQLSGFAKGRDLLYFSRVIANMSYEHRLDMAPTPQLLKEYRANALSWDEYAKQYVALIESRDILATTPISQLDQTCLLCSEHLPERCHRSLLASYLQRAYPHLLVTHLY